jgi:hypothetical protein
MLSKELFTYALFILPLFFIGAFLVTGLPVAVSIHSYYKNRGRQSVTRPEVHYQGGLSSQATAARSR